MSFRPKYILYNSDFLFRFEGFSSGMGEVTAHFWVGAGEGVERGRTCEVKVGFARGFASPEFICSTKDFVLDRKLGSRRRFGTADWALFLPAASTADFCASLA